MHGKRLKRSPIKKDYDFTKTRDFSPEATRDLPGHKIAEAVTPKGLIDVIPMGGKVVKGAKAIYNLIKS